MSLQEIREMADDLDIILSYIGVDQELHELRPDSELIVVPENEDLRYLLGVEKTH